MYRFISKFHFCDIRNKLFNLSLIHAINHGFNNKALQQACFDLNISSAASTVIQPIDLIHYSMRKWNREIIDTMTFDENFKQFTVSNKIKNLIKHRLQLQSPYMGRWNEAMALGVQNADQTRAILWQFADDCWYLAGDKSQDYNHYTKRMMFLYIYISTELFMLTDKSPNFFMTWDFLERRMSEIKDFGSQIELVTTTMKTLWNSGYYMTTMFYNFPKGTLK
ncbi:unnamed protein product [Paramecium sonneborni]|uniref:Ubiquinone biosynthesis protein n=1 Tax=Paramecium sonneborni TaxID=65129 RepID=A0A8S1P7S9_9CILI|nr:unnamed protein product [Paramecium sonneborni]